MKETFTIFQVYRFSKAARDWSKVPTRPCPTGTLNPEQTATLKNTEIVAIFLTLTSIIHQHKGLSGDYRKEKIPITAREKADASLVNRSRALY